MSGTVVYDALGPRGRRISRAVAMVGVALALAIGVGMLWALRTQLLNPEKWAPFTNPKVWTGTILPGLLSTLEAAIVAMVLAFALGSLLGIGRLSQRRIISIPCGVIVEFFRSVPVLLMMIFFYYVFLFNHLAGDELLPFAAVVLGLMFYNGSVIAELIRSGVTNLPRGQQEAGLAIGLTRGQTLRNVLLPQAITAMLPSLLSQLVVIVKDTALGFVVTYPDLTRSLQTLASNYGNIMAALIVAGVIYILVNLGITSLAERVEARVRRSPTVRAVQRREPLPVDDD